MSKPSKPAQSGLRTLKREWSDASDAAASSSQPIEWLPTPPATRPVLPKATNPNVTNASKRLEVIRAALAAANPETRVTSTVASQKRPSQESASDVPAKKPRQLPPGYKDTVPTRSIISRSNSENRPTGQRTNSSNTTGGGTKAQTMTVMAPVVKKPIQKVAKVFLSQEQTYILKLVQEGQSVFYTGSAGTGKSVLLREIIKTMRKIHGKTYDAVAITASTGIAACNIGGITIHSFAGIGLGVENADVLVDRIKKNRKASTRWLKTKVLIIDEVSMLDGDLFDKLAIIGSVLKKRPSTPFGGIQLIVTGDFFQLPPVTKGNSSTVKFAFEAEKWNETIKHTFNLTKVFRQKDQEFVDMLNEMRFGRLSQKSVNKFKSLSRTITYDDGLGPTELFPRREDVERSNSNRMRNLNTDEMCYTASEGGTLKGTDQGEKLLSNFMAPPQLFVRVDAQVMLIKNIDEQLVNGTMGRIIEFVDPASVEFDESGSTGAPPAKKSASGTILRYPVVEFSLANGGKRKTIVTPETWKVELPSGELQVSRTQFPLILAWAMSIHKSQGQTLDRVKVDLNRVFEKGQAYVALSRATSLDGLQVLNFDPTKVKAHDKVARWSETLKTIEDLS